MVVAVVLSVPLVSAFAAGKGSGAGTGSDESGVTVAKSATGLENDTTTVTLKVGATQEKDKVAVMFLLDKSTSQGMRDEAADMLSELKTKTNTELYYNVVIFSGTATSTGWKNIVDDKSLNETLANFANREPTTGTNMDSGITKALSQMDEVPEGVDSTYLVTLSDGISYFWLEDGNVMTVPVLQQSTVENPNPGEQSVHDDASAWDTFYTITDDPLETKSFAEIYGSFDKFLNEVPKKINATKDASYAKKFGSGYSIESTDLLIAPIYENDERDKIASKYAIAPEISAYECVQGYEKLVGKFDESFTFAAPEALSEGVDNLDSWRNYPWGKELMEHLNSMSTNAGKSEISNADPESVFSGIRDEILYQIKSGIVTDVIGNNFGLVSLDSFTLKVDGEKLDGVVNKDANTVTFGNNEEYVVTYYKEGSSSDPREQFSWDINTPVEQGTGLELSYDLKLVNKETTPGIHTVPTNEDATLEYEPTIGQGGTETFPVPKVTYTVAAPALDISKSKTAQNLVKDENGDWVSDVTLSLPSAEYKKSMDIVFVIDDSYGTSAVFKDAAMSVLKELANKENLDVKVGLVTFDGVARDWLAATSGLSGLVSISDSTALDALGKAISTPVSTDSEGIQYRVGGSNTEWAVDMAAQMLNAGDGEDKYIVMFSDLYGYVYRGTIGSSEDVPMSKRRSYDQGDLATDPPMYETWSEVNSNRNSDNPAYDSFFRKSMWKEYWKNIKGTEVETEDQEGIQKPSYDEIGNYFTPFEKSTYLTYDNIIEAVSDGIRVVIANNNFNPDVDQFGQEVQTIKNGMLDDLKAHGVSVIQKETSNAEQAFSDSDIEEIFSDIKDELIQLVDEDSYVVDEIGYGTLDGNNYNFDFVVDVSHLTLTVGGQQLKAQDANVGGATKAWSFVDGENNEQFTLEYYEDGAAIGGVSYGECFVWTSKVAITKDAQVQLTYRVKLTDPQTEPGSYGEYDRDGSQNHSGLYTNNSATLFPVDSEEKPGEPQQFNKPTVSYTVEEETATIRPADITIYMGGSDGYEGVVQGDLGDGDVVGEKVNSLPEPGYYFQLTPEMNAAIQNAYFAGGSITDEEDGFVAVDLSEYVKVMSTEDSRNKYEWSLVRYGSEDNDSTAYDRFVYRLVPVENTGTDDVRLQFTPEGGGDPITSDNFSPSSANSLQETYAMGIYPDDIGDVELVATVNGTEYTAPISLEDGQLHVRYVTGDQNMVVTAAEPNESAVNDKMAADAKTEADTGEEYNKAYVVAPSDTTYMINESSIDLDSNEEPAPSLLFDDVVSHQNTGEILGQGDADYAEQLGEAAIETLGNAVDADTAQYEAKYLDLVDANNGNTWLQAKNADGKDQTLTVYWPYPTGTDSSDTFHVVHFEGEGMERDNFTDDVNNGVLDSKIDGATKTVVVSNAEKTPYGIKFTTSSFSPFVLVWGTSNGSTDPEPPTPSDNVGDLKVSKTVTGNLANLNDEFTFRVTVEGAGDQIYGGVKFTNNVATITLNGGETVTIKNLPKGAKYTVEEIDGLDYELVSSKNTSGTIPFSSVTASFVNDKSEPETLDPTDPVNPGGSKVLLDADGNPVALAGGEFTFKLTGLDGAPMPAGAVDDSITVTNRADGVFVFGDIVFDEAGTYTYELTEVAGTDEGITYDGSTHTLVVVVSDEDADGDGKLDIASLTYDGESTLPTFTNETTSDEPPAPDSDQPGTDEPAEPTTPGVPDTGDHTVSALPAVLALGGVALVGGALAVARRRVR